MAYLYTTVNGDVFHDSFIAYGRGEQFSYEGRKALFEYLEQLAEDLGDPMELDVIALCCDYSEYKDLAEFNVERAADYESWDDVADETQVIEHSNGAAIVQAF